MCRFIVLKCPSLLLDGTTFLADAYDLTPGQLTAIIRLFSTQLVTAADQEFLNELMRQTPIVKNIWTYVEFLAMGRKDNLFGEFDLNYICQAFSLYE